MRSLAQNCALSHNSPKGEHRTRNIHSILWSVQLCTALEPLIGDKLQPRMVVIDMLRYRQISHSFAGTCSCKKLTRCSAAKFELRVCTNKTCRKQGSKEVCKNDDLSCLSNSFLQNKYVIWLDWRVEAAVLKSQGFSCWLQASLTIYFCRCWHLHRTWVWMKSRWRALGV